MRKARVLLLIIVLLATGCGPLGQAATPTPAPNQLADPAMQRAALAAVQEYADRLGYAYRNPSFDLIWQQSTTAAVHVSVGFQTRKGFAYEDYDALFTMQKTDGGWQADQIKATTKLEWEQTLTRGPATLSGDAGFVVSIPAGWSAYAAPASELKSASACGIGPTPVSSVIVLLVVPTGYSAVNAPIALRGYQQCPRASDLTYVRQQLEGIRASDKTISFKTIEMTRLGGKPALLAIMTDANNTVAHDYYVVHRDRQLEFVVQTYAGIDTTQILAMLTGMQFK